MGCRIIQYTRDGKEKGERSLLYFSEAEKTLPPIVLEYALYVYFYAVLC